VSRGYGKEFSQKEKNKIKNLKKLLTNSQIYAIIKSQKG
jgi:hypothetical protein